jgi:hypothetical protein
MNGRANLEIRLAPTRISVQTRGPVKIGDVVPALLERYGLDPLPAAAATRRQVQMSAVWLGQKSLAGLELS